MIFRDTDLVSVEAVCAEMPEIETTIINKTHLGKEFWEVEILCPNIFTIYQIGSFIGYKECREKDNHALDEANETLDKMLIAAKLLKKENEKLSAKIKTLINGK